MSYESNPRRDLPSDATKQPVSGSQPGYKLWTTPGGAPQKGLAGVGVLSNDPTLLSGILPGRTGAPASPPRAGSPTAERSPPSRRASWDWVTPLPPAGTPGSYRPDGCIVLQAAVGGAKR